MHAGWFRCFHEQADGRGWLREAKHNGTLHVFTHLAVRNWKLVFHDKSLPRYRFPLLTPRTSIFLLPEVGQKGQHPLPARPRPRWGTSDWELNGRKKINQHWDLCSVFPDKHWKHSICLWCRVSLPFAVVFYTYNKGTWCKSHKQTSEEMTSHRWLTKAVC